MNTCSTCQFFYDGKECRRFPPAVVPYIADYTPGGIDTSYVDQIP